MFKLNVFEYAEDVKNIAKKELEEKGSITPIFILITPINTTIPLPFMFKYPEEKKELFRKFRYIIRLMDIRAYVIVTEGYGVYRPMNMDRTNFKASEQPDRQEQLLVIAVTKERKKCWSIDFEKEYGRMMLEEEKIIDTEDPKTVKLDGTLFNFLEE